MSSISYRSNSEEGEREVSRLGGSNSNSNSNINMKNMSKNMSNRSMNCPGESSSRRITNTSNNANVANTNTANTSTTTRASILNTEACGILQTNMNIFSLPTTTSNSTSTIHTMQQNTHTPKPQNKGGPAAKYKKCLDGIRQTIRELRKKHSESSLRTHLSVSSRNSVSSYKYAHTGGSRPMRSPPNAFANQILETEYAPPLHSQSGVATPKLIIYNRSKTSERSRKINKVISEKNILGAVPLPKISKGRIMSCKKVKGGGSLLLV